MSNYDDLVPSQVAAPPAGTSYDDLIPASKDQPSTTMSTIRGFGNGFTGGLSKYVGTGALWALGPLFDSSNHWSGEGWSNALDSVNQQRDEDRTVHPEAYQLGNIGGAATMGYLTGGTSLLRNVAVGATTGAANAVNESDKLSDAGSGAIIGGVLGGTAGVLSKGVQSVAGKVSQGTFAKVLGPNGSGSGSGSGIFTQLGLQGLKAVGGGLAGAGIDYGANHMFGKGDKTFSDSMTSMPAEIGAMAGGYSGSGGLPGAIRAATSGAVSKIATTGVSRQVVNTAIQPVIDQVAPSQNGTNTGNTPNTDMYAPQAPVNSTNNIYSPQAPVNSTNNIYDTRRPLQKVADELIRPKPEVQLPSFVTYGGMDDPLPNVRSQSGTITGTSLEGNPYKGWTADQIANKFGTGRTYLNNVRINPALQAWDNANNANNANNSN